MVPGGASVRVWGVEVGSGIRVLCFVTLVFSLVGADVTVVVTTGAMLVLFASLPLGVVAADVLFFPTVPLEVAIEVAVGDAAVPDIVVVVLATGGMLVLFAILPLGVVAAFVLSFPTVRLEVAPEVVVEDATVPGVVLALLADVLLLTVMFCLSEFLVVIKGATVVVLLFTRKPKPKVESLNKREWQVYRQTDKIAMAKPTKTFASSVGLFSRMCLSVCLLAVLFH